MIGEYCVRRGGMKVARGPMTIGAAVGLSCVLHTSNQFIFSSTAGHMSVVVGTLSHEHVYTRESRWPIS